jgi:predicted nicotinamide N-methyase
MRVPLLPEIDLELAAEGTELFDATGGAYRSDEPPPFWSFAWPGGVALARFLLDHPERVAGRVVLDLGAGSGLVAIAAALAGAAEVIAVDPDPGARAAAGRNATRNGVRLRTASDVPSATASATGVELIVAGDVFYSPVVGPKVLKVLQAAAVEVLVGDPGRGFLPEQRFEPLAEYDVPVRRELEDGDVMRTTIWRLKARAES